MSCERRGLRGVHLEAAADDLIGVVRAALLLGALQQALDQLLGVGLEQDDRVEAGAGQGEDAVELGDLALGARVSSTRATFQNTTDTPQASAKSSTMP